MNMQYNEFASQMMENRPVMAQLEADEMSKKDWKKYLEICDGIATTAYKHTQTGNFAPFRSAVHALLTFLEMDTKLLGIDSYTTMFLPSVVPYVTIRSDAYKKAVKNITTFKKAMKWACEVSKVEDPNEDTTLFSDCTTREDYETLHFPKDNQEQQDYYNALVGIVKNTLADHEPVKYGALQTHLAALEAIRDKLAEEPKNYYKDYKNPMKSTSGKPLKHAPASIRKGIENTIADIINIRSMMSPEQEEKEQAQIQAGKEVTKEQANARRDARNGK